MPLWGCDAEFEAQVGKARWRARVFGSLISEETELADPDGDGQPFASQAAPAKLMGVPVGNHRSRMTLQAGFVTPLMASAKPRLIACRGTTESIVRRPQRSLQGPPLKGVSRRDRHRRVPHNAALRPTAGSSSDETDGLVGDPRQGTCERVAARASRQCRRSSESRTLSDPQVRER